MNPRIAIQKSSGFCHICFICLFGGEGTAVFQSKSQASFHFSPTGYISEVCKHFFHDPMPLSDLIELIIP